MRFEREAPNAGKTSPALPRCGLMKGNVKPAMQAAKYFCRQCSEQFDLLGECPTEKLRCPRCSSPSVDQYIACKLEVGPPPWKFECRLCRCTFSVQSPSGPDEAKSIRCPVCAGEGVKWLSLVSEACPPGG